MVSSAETFFFPREGGGGGSPDQTSFLPESVPTWSSKGAAAGSGVAGGRAGTSGKLFFGRSASEVSVGKGGGGGEARSKCLTS